MVYFSSKFSTCDDLLMTKLSPLIFLTGGHQEAFVHHEAGAHEGQRADGELPDLAVHRQDEQRHLHAAPTAEEIHVRYLTFKKTLNDWAYSSIEIRTHASRACSMRCCLQSASVFLI